VKLRSTVAALAAVFVLAGCAPKTPTPSPPLEPPKAELRVEHVDFVTVIPPIPPGPQVPRPLYGGRPEDRPALEQLLRALAAATPVDQAGADSEHRRMEWLDIHLIDGRRIMVRSAWICHTEGDGTGCTTVRGKLVIAEGESRRVVEAPALEAFLSSGRAEAMPAVERMTLEDGALEAGETATVRGDGWAGAKAYQLTLEGAGRKMTLTEGLIRFGGFTWTGRVPTDLPTGEYMLQLRMDTGAGVGHPVLVKEAPTGASNGAAAGLPAWVPDLDGVVWSQVRFGLPSPGASTPLHPGRPSEIPALARIAQWLGCLAVGNGSMATAGRKRKRGPFSLTMAAEGGGSRNIRVER